MRVLYFKRSEFQPNDLLLGNFHDRQREQGMVISGSVDISEEKNAVWVSGSGVSVQSRGCVPTSEFYTQGGVTAESYDWNPAEKGGHSVAFTVSRSSELGKFIQATEKAVAVGCLRAGVIKGYSDAQAISFVRSSLREYERVLTFTSSLDSFTVVKNKDLSSSPYAINSWQDNPLTPGYGVSGIMLKPTYFSVVSEGKGKDPKISVHFKCLRFEVERRLTPEERLESIVNNPGQSEWATMVNTALTWEPSDGDDDDAVLAPESPKPLKSSIRSSAPSIKKKHAEAKKLEKLARSFIDDEAVEESDY